MAGPMSSGRCGPQPAAAKLKGASTPAPALPTTLSDGDGLLVLPEDGAEPVADLADGDVPLHALEDPRDQVLAPAGGPFQGAQGALDRRLFPPGAERGEAAPGGAMRPHAMGPWAPGRGAGILQTGPVSGHRG